MILTIAVIIALFIFLFTFHYYAKDDYYFIRKSITMEQLFNVLFLGLFWGYVIARIGYIILFPDISYVNPLVFFLVTYYPGLSISGGVIGMYLAFIYLTNKRKISPLRFLDYVSYSLLSVLPFLIVSLLLLRGKTDLMQGLYLTIIFIVLFLYFKFTLLPRFIRGALKEGSMTLNFLILFSVVFLLRDVVLLYLNRSKQLIQPEGIFYMILFFVSAIFLIRQEMRKGKK